MKVRDNSFSSYKPEVDLSGASQNVVGSPIEVDRGEAILRAVAKLVEDSLDACVGPDVPNLDDLIGSQTDQVESIFVESQVLDRSIVPIEVRESSKCERVPHDDVSLFSATGNEPVLT